MNIVKGFFQMTLGVILMSIFFGTGFLAIGLLVVCVLTVLGFMFRVLKSLEAKKVHGAATAGDAQHSELVEVGSVKGAEFPASTVVKTAAIKSEVETGSKVRLSVVHWIGIIAAVGLLTLWFMVDRPGSGLKSTTALVSTPAATPDVNPRSDAVGQDADADADAAAAAKGLMIASILHEKCTGKQPAQNETERQVKILQAQGFLLADIRRGFMEGMLYAESTYPRNKKPPQSECKLAIGLYDQLMKSL